MISASGRRKGFTHDDSHVPDEFFQDIYWFRASVPVAGDDEDRSAPLFFWIPGTEEDDDPVSWRRCFDSLVGVTCPCGAYIGKMKPYRKGLALLVGCGACGSKWRPQFKDGQLHWYRLDGEYMGNNNAPPILEYME